MHLGRLDLQAKLSGFRVEIGEIEAYLQACPGIAEAAVVPHMNNQNEHALTAFAVRDETISVSAMDIRSHLQDRVPRHMVPSRIIFVDAIPFTPNGKIDRAALGSLRKSALEEKPLIEAGTPTEKALCEIWMQLLEREKIGMNDDFFEIEGNSLLAMRLLARLEEDFGIQIEVSAIFQNPTVAQLAGLIDSLMDEMSPVG